ncbi:MAG: energy-coupling factor transporter transmembrane component T [Halobacteriales archaeon]
MLTYKPGDSPAHRLDPRAKLAVQFGFAAAAVAHTTPVGLAALTPVALGALAAAHTSPLAALRAFRYPVALLAVAPLVEGAAAGAPWFVVGDAVPTALASYRVLLVLLVSAAYVRTTPARDSRAAIQHTVPGRAGALLGIGVAATFRFFPLLRRDVTGVREAVRARLGGERPARERMQLVAVAALNRAFRRADTFGLALRARCLSWNPTLPALQFRRRDRAVTALAAALAATAVL